MQYEINTFNYFDTLVRFLKAQPINLAGIAAPSGGQGGGAGYIGYLPQTRVAYDETEAATLATAISGSLLDNLNHIRYQITTLSGIAAGGVIIKEGGVVVASGVTIVDFINDFEITEITPTAVTVALVAASGVVTLSGVHNEDLTSQIDGITQHFDLINVFHPGYLRLYYNGLRQDGNFTADVDFGGFSLDFTPIVGDSLVADYDVAVSGYGGTYGHTHSQYVTLAYLESNYYSDDDINDILGNKADNIHTHIEADITNLEHNAVAIQGVPVSGIIPADESILQYDSDTGVWSPTSLSGFISNTIHQQTIFSVEGANLKIGDVGIKPLKMFVHEVGIDCHLEEVFCAVDTAPGATDLHINVLKNGVTVFNAPTYLTIPVGSGYASRANFSNDQLIKNDYLQFQLVQGDNTASDLTVHVRFKWEAS